MRSKIRILFVFLLIVCWTVSAQEKSRYMGGDVELATIETDANGVAVLSDEQVEEIVKRSYQYVAMYNVNQKLALAEEGMTTRGYNKGKKTTELLDHSVQAIARPNNDVLYQFAMIDLRKDAFVFEIPAMESKYVSLLTSSYDHYVQIPMSTVDGDFKVPRTILLYTERTKSYSGEKMEGIDETYEMTGDFVHAVFRVMPHANEPERFKRVIEQINALKWMTLSEYLGKPAPKIDDVEFPPYGTTDADIFENNLLEVMQFVFNHTTFDPDFELDREVLAVYEPLGIVPGKEYNPNKAVKIDGEKFREISIKVRDEQIAIMNDHEETSAMLPLIFQPKGTIGLEPMLCPSIVGPIGQPAKEAMYPAISTAYGAPMNAQHDYLIRMTADELPPANAFWSFTLYDAGNVFLLASKARLSDLRHCAGVGLRYLLPFGPVRLDFAYALNPEPGENRYRFIITLGHAF
ncbi:MAG: DUF1254 domain-containing protein [Candidatus Aminicenantes bacterium]